MLPAYITHADCARHEMGPHHPECPARLGAINDRLLVSGLLDVMQPYDAPLAEERQLALAHDSDYVREIAQIAPASGFAMLDPDTVMNPYTHAAALRAAGAAVLGTDLVCNGDAPVAFCNIRPPGHHAESAAAMGFCFFNNAAIAVRHALEAHALERVALIDFDVHHGNGSEEILADDPRVLMCSIFERGLYPFSGDMPRGSNMLNFGMPPRSGGDLFREIVEQRWMPALDAFAPELIVISAGFDAHREDELGHLALVEADYEWVTHRLMAVARKHANGRVVSMLEGGYALSALGRSVAAHVKVLIGAAG